RHEGCPRSVRPVAGRTHRSVCCSGETTKLVAPTEVRIKSPPAREGIRSRHGSPVRHRHTSCAEAHAQASCETRDVLRSASARNAPLASDPGVGLYHRGFALPLAGSATAPSRVTEKK